MDDTKPDALAEALLQVLPVLNALPEPWFVLGSYGLRLHGLPVACHDIDVVTSGGDARRLRQLWRGRYAEAAGQPGPSSRFRSVFSRFLVNGCRVEIMGDLEVNTPAGWRNAYRHVQAPQTLMLHGHPVAVPSLPDCLALYRLFGRPKDVDKISLIEARLSGR